MQGVRGQVGQDVHSGKGGAGALDNIVGSLWQARQESSGSSVGNQVRPSNGAGTQKHRLSGGWTWTGQLLMDV